MNNYVWDIVPKPKGKSVVDSKWIYKIKHAVDGSIEKYKAKFVARGFYEKEGIDDEETFAPVARYTSIRTIMALASMMKLSLHQMDVKTVVAQNWHARAEAQKVSALARRQLLRGKPMSPHSSLLASGWLFSNSRGDSLR